MMKKICLVVLCLVAASLATVAEAQKKAADYKVTAIKIAPFEKQTGKLEAEIAAQDERSFFNDISKTYLVMVEVSGEAGSFEVGRRLEIVVTEGNKPKAKKLEQIDLIGEAGKIYMPLWIDQPLCDEVNISARIVGQKTAASLKRKLTVFQCGE